MRITTSFARYTRRGIRSILTCLHFPRVGSDSVFIAGIVTRIWMRNVALLEIE